MSKANDDMTLAETSHAMEDVEHHEKKKKTLTDEEDDEWKKLYGIHKSGDRFRATITLPSGRVQWLGSFKHPEPAALAYDIANYYLHGSKALLNFPRIVRTLMAVGRRHKHKLLSKANLVKLFPSMTLLDTKEEEEVDMLGGFRGVKKYGDDTFIARIKCRSSGRMIYIGSYVSPEAAALCHDIAAYNLYKSNGVFNFRDIVRILMGLRRRARVMALEANNISKLFPALTLEDTPKKLKNEEQEPKPNIDDK